MKIHYVAALLLCSFAVNGLQAEEPIKWPTKSMVIDTGWVNSDPSASCPKTHYPVCVEIMPLKGDGARYKAVFIPKPKGDFDYKSIVGIKTEEYEKLSKDLMAKGFIQISHQVVTFMVGNVHQAVWVSHTKREPVAPSDGEKTAN